MAASSFRELARARGLKDKVVDKLIDNDFDTEDAVAVMTEEDMKDLALTVGSKRLLLTWRDDLSVARTPSITSGAEGGETKAATSRQVSDDCDTDSHANEPIIDPEPIDLDTGLKELNMSEETLQEMRRYVEQHGVDGLQQKIDNQLNLYKTCKVQIAVTGQSGHGKSTMINTLRNLKAHDDYAAAVGISETTLKPTPYVFPKVPNVILWDLPGVNTPLFPQDSYLVDVGFEKYDAFIIVIATRLTNNDLWLAKESQKLGIPFFFLRSKIDNDVDSHKRDSKNPDVETMLQETKLKLQKQMENEGLPTSNIYLVSGVLAHRHKWNFPAFFRDLHENTPEKKFNKEALCFAMLATSGDILRTKFEYLEDRLHNVVVKAIIDNDNYDAVLQGEVILYTECLGITNQDLQDLDKESLDLNLQEIVKGLDTIMKAVVGSTNSTLADNIIRVLTIPMRQNKAIQAHGILADALDKCFKLAVGVLKARAKDP